MNKHSLMTASIVLLLALTLITFGCTSTGNVTGTGTDTNKVTGTTPISVTPTTSTNTTPTAGTTTPQVKTVTIYLDANRFEYSQPIITVKEGDHVIINVNNVDTTHGIAIPDFNVSGKTSVDFIANKKGTFEFHCPTMCGPGHREMGGTLIVE